MVGVFLALSDSVGRRELALVGMLTGILPAVQHQVFLCTIIYLAVFLAVNFALERKKLPEFLGMVVFFAITVAVPLVHYLPRRNRAPMVAREVFWADLVDRGVFFPQFMVWWQALGVFFVTVVVFPVFVLDKKLLKFYGPSLVVFLFLNGYRLQPYSRQNIIGFYPLWMIPASIVFFVVFKRLQARFESEESKGFVIGLGVVIFFVSIFSGILGVRSLRNSISEEWNPQIEKVANWIAANTPRKAVFISTSERFDPIVELAGKQSFFQNAQAAWEFGYNLEDRETQIHHFLENGDSTALLPKVTHVLNWEKHSVHRHLIRWGDGNWTKIYNSDGFVLFQKHAV
jgi:hypothetical protein